MTNPSKKDKLVVIWTIVIMAVLYFSIVITNISLF